MTKDEVSAILIENGFRFISGPDNDGYEKYSVTLEKDWKDAWLGNYFLEIDDQATALPYADSGMTKEQVLAFIGVNLV